MGREQTADAEHGDAALQDNHGPPRQAAKYENKQG